MDPGPGDVSEDLRVAEQLVSVMSVLIATQHFQTTTSKLVRHVLTGLVAGGLWDGCSASAPSGLDGGRLFLLLELIFITQHLSRLPSQRGTSTPPVSVNQSALSLSVPKL